jgi:tRNA(Arg) A34 adenosine deaminase TadA
VRVTLPAWLHDYQESLRDKVFTTDEEMMDIAVEISARNVAQDTGGPFGCAIFQRNKSSGKCTLFSVGANRVTVLNNSTLHGEMVAIQFAQKQLQHYSMKASSAGKEYILVTSCEPCAMCLGGTLWSGVSELICSATKNDAEAIGFNEGPVWEESYKHLEEAGIKVKRNILRKKGSQVLEEYGNTGIIYNG